MRGCGGNRKWKYVYTICRHSFINWAKQSLLQLARYFAKMNVRSRFLSCFSSILLSMCVVAACIGVCTSQPSPGAAYVHLHRTLYWQASRVPRPGPQITATTDTISQHPMNITLESCTPLSLTFHMWEENSCIVN